MTAATACASASPLPELLCVSGRARSRTSARLLVLQTACVMHAMGSFRAALRLREGSLHLPCCRFGNFR
jgi:hypothetical protein